MQSFHNWEISPIATTLDTVPIEQVTYPQIYVCPPKNTFTNLNYDLENVPDEKLEPEFVNELLRLVDEKIQESELEKTLDDINLYEEQDRFNHWYLDLSELRLINPGDPVLCGWYNILAIYDEANGKKRYVKQIIF